MTALAAQSTAESLQGAVDSLLAGNYKQALFRAVGFGVSAYGTYRASASAFDTMTGVINGSKCFVAGTLVLTEDGEKPIEEIEVGDYVYSTDPETGESEYKEVLWTYQRESYELVHVFVADKEIVTTPNHPFWVESEWIVAGNLQTGDILTLADGSKVAICHIFT